MSYNLYGNPMASYGAGFGFTGEMTDSTGQVYLRARYYEPTLGIFSALDPFEGMMQRPMSLNGYSWVEGNPVMYTDPSGRFLALLAAAAIGGLIGGAIYGYGSQVAENLQAGQELGTALTCIDSNVVAGSVLLGGGVGRLLGVAIAVGQAVGVGYATFAGASSNIIGMGLAGVYDDVRTIDELVQRLTIDMAIGGVSGTILAGVMNGLKLAPLIRPGVINPSVVARGVAAGTINTIQGVVQRVTRSHFFGDDVSINPDPMDFALGFGLQNIADIFSLRYTGGGRVADPFRYNSGIPIIRPLSPNPQGMEIGIRNLSQFQNLPANQALFTITGTNIGPNALEAIGEQYEQFQLELVDERGNEINDMVAECNR